MIIFWIDKTILYYGIDRLIEMYLNASYIETTICSHFSEQMFHLKWTTRKIQNKYRYSTHTYTNTRSREKKKRSKSHSNRYYHYQRNHYNVYFVMGANVLRATALINFKWFVRKQLTFKPYLFRNWQMSTQYIISDSVNIFHIIL